MVPTIMAAAIPMRRELGEIFISIYNDTGGRGRGQPEMSIEMRGLEKGWGRTGRIEVFQKKLNRRC
jgi:hypothetical protein